MTTCTHELDTIQGILGDTATIGLDGPLWSRATLLRYLNDGYRALLTQSQAVRRWVVLDVPGRFTMTGTQPWEARFANGGTFEVFTWQAPGYACTSLWEVEFLEGLTPEGASEAVSQPWERCFLNPAGVPYRFALPKDSERIQALYFDHRRLVARDVRELDALARDWRSLAGLPLTWTMGTGQTGTFELFDIVMTDSQTYRQDGGPWGLPHTFSGTRTYDTGTSETLYGIARTVRSPDRQYLATQGCWGLPRQYRSSEGALLLLEVVGPELPDLLESDTPDLLPPQMGKYLRFYALAQAWLAQGEGHNEPLAALCLQLFQRGVQVLRALSWLTRLDESVQRRMHGPVGERRVPRPRLPATYPVP